MRNIVSTRLMRSKKEWKSLLSWMLLPLIMTVVIMQSIESWQEETKVPVALVVEDETEMAGRLVEDIAATELFHIQFMNLDDALHKLEQHELDSVFVIRKGYEDNILSNRRNQLIVAFSSNRSFANQAVVETIASFAQQDAARSKAAFVIKHLFMEYGMEEEWHYDEIIDSSRDRQKSEALLQSSFSYYDKQNRANEQSIPLVKAWGVWTIFAIITTFFLFDWMLKENRPSMRQRWLFTEISFKKYALGSLLLLTAIIYAMDIITAIIFTSLFQEAFTIRVLFVLFVFRLTINLLAFLLASLYRQLFMYYTSGLAIALLLAVVGGAIIPLDGLARKWVWVEALSPVQSLLNGTIPILWLCALVVLLGVWFFKGGEKNA
ncbi:ABC transporter permease [Sporosarcina sp. JAI121]|uniref:ABC transporter permease n=1 Tax=Sporosarcina sp. JAI121 TaxID=2723064 RepID=UPI0015CB94AE|nr:ABC transporter permease [Sporosarcina sp. JAI121]NYF25340.1 ABC-2 type transport system permease protein [Sporosarcina sp. JAI121]